MRRPNIREKLFQDVRGEWKEGQEMETEGCVESKKGLAQL